MDNKPQQQQAVDAARRGFLRKAGLAGGAAAATMAARVSAAPAPAPEEKETGPGRGYQETDHVRAYYATARI